MEIEDAETVLRQAQDERKQKVRNGNTPFVLSLSKHEQGAHLARMELRAFFRELLPRIASIELAGEPEYTATTFVGGPKHVPIRYRLRPAPSTRSEGS